MMADAQGQELCQQMADAVGQELFRLADQHLEAHGDAARRAIAKNLALAPLIAAVAMAKSAGISRASFLQVCAKMALDMKEETHG